MVVCNCMICQFFILHVLKLVHPSRNMCLCFIITLHFILYYKYEYKRSTMLCTSTCTGGTNTVVSFQKYNTMMNNHISFIINSHGRSYVTSYYVWCQMCWRGSTTYANLTKEWLIVVSYRTSRSYDMYIFLVTFVNRNYNINVNININNTNDNI